MFSPPRLSPTDLTDAEWQILEPLIPAAKPGGRPSKWMWRVILNGIFYPVRSGCHWRLLPSEFPPWKTVYHYFRTWRIDGTWEQLNATLRERERTRQGRNSQPSGCIMDSQSARPTSVGGVRGYDKGPVRAPSSHLAGSGVYRRREGLDRAGAEGSAEIVKHAPCPRGMWVFPGQEIDPAIFRRPEGFRHLPRRRVIEPMFSWFGQSRRCPKTMSGSQRPRRPSSMPL